MKRTVRSLSIVLMLILVFSFIPGNAGRLSASASGDAIPPWELKINKSLKLSQGQSVPLDVVILKEGERLTGEEFDTEKAKIEWTSSKPSVATVDKDGKVTYVSPGKTVVTATLKDHPGGNGKDAACTCKVTTSELGAADGFKIEADPNMMLWVGDAPRNLISYFTVTGGSGDITWESSNNKVAEIQNNSKLAVKGRGVATITATDSKGNKATANICVDEFYCESTKPSPAKWKSKSKDTLDFHFKCDYHDAITNGCFEGVFIDDDTKELSKSNYTTEAGSVWVRLKPEYLDTLAVGKKHYLEALFILDGEKVYTQKVEFTIYDSSKGPSTKDATLIGLGIFLFLLSLTYVVLFTYDKKTHKFRRRNYAKRRYY